jgi:hypothetical protein
MTFYYLKYLKIQDYRKKPSERYKYVALGWNLIMKNIRFKIKFCKIGPWFSDSSPGPTPTRISLPEGCRGEAQSHPGQEGQAQACSRRFQLSYLFQGSM